MARADTQRDLALGKGACARIAAFARRSRVALADDVDGASLGVFRAGIGVFLCVAAIRFFAHDWVDKYYVAPKVFFPYWGLGFVRPLPGHGMAALYAVIGTLGALLAWGARHRLVAALAFVAFSYAHLSDKTNYLNHYYLVSLVLFLLALAPVGAGPSSLAPARVQRVWLWLFRFQIACVYLGGGLAKLRTDWLVHAQPLGIWLSSNAEIPLLGPLFARKSVAYVMSWAGAAYDLSIPFLLLGKGTRKYAYALVVAFHLLTARLFQIGLFPWIMMFASLVFLDPDYPRRIPLLARSFAPTKARPNDAGAAPDLAVAPRLPAPLAVLVALYVLVQIGMPLRHFAYPGNTLWTESGYRFAWHVMLMEKNGALELTVVDPASGRRWDVEPHDYLTPQQAKQMSTQPDMILAFAHVVRDDFARRGISGVRVYASTSEVSLNGRAPAPLVDPRVDLAAVEDGIGGASFLLPAPTSSPMY